MTINVAALFVTDISVNSPNWSRYMSLVSAEKQNKASAYVRAEDRVRTVLGEVLARTMLSERTGLPTQEFSFTANDYGKPQLADMQNVHFNVAHSGGWVVCALGEKPLGIDVEQVVPIDTGLVEPAFAPEEREYLRAVPEEQRFARFYELWTLKESYIKAVGHGLSMPLDAFSIVPERPIRCRQSGGAADGSFELYEVLNGYKLALCSLGEEPPEQIEIWGERELLGRLLPAKLPSEMTERRRMV